MDHDWSGVVADRIFSLLILARTLTSVVFELEFLGKLEVKLNGGALMLPSQGIGNGDINLRSVESTILWVELPFGIALSGEPVQSVSQLSLSPVPGGNFSKEFLRTSRQFELEGETEDSVYLLQQVENTLNL